MGDAGGVVKVEAGYARIRSGPAGFSSGSETNPSSYLNGFGLTHRQTIRSTGILPLDPSPSSSLGSANRAASQRFTQLLDSPSIPNLDDIIVTTMKCLHRLSQALKQSPYGDQGRMERIAQLKWQAMALVSFAGGMRLRLGGDVYRQLSSMSECFLSGEFAPA